MGWQEIVLLFAGGVLAGCINVLAGGAGFMTFPLLVAAGMSEIEANASNFVALLPANIASLYGYRHELRRPTLMLRPRLALVGDTVAPHLLDRRLRLGADHQALARASA